MVQCNGEIVVVDPPQLLEEEFRLAARVDEDERRLVRLDESVNLGERVPRRMSGPGQMLGGVEHRHMRLRAGLADDDVGETLAFERLRHQETAQVVWLGDRRGEADGGETRRERMQPRQPEREKIAALRGDERMQLVEHDALERAEEIRRVGGGEQQGELLRCRQQDVGWVAALPLPLRRRRVAGARLEPDRQFHLVDRRLEIARNVDRERLQGRDIERVQPASSFSRLRGEGGEARSAESDEGASLLCCRFDAPSPDLASLGRPLPAGGER